MPTGTYRLDWVDDTTAEIIRTDSVAAGDMVTAPSFRRHIAAIPSPAP